MPPLWHLQELFQLSDEYPTGLAWAINKGKYKIGDSVGTRNKQMVIILFLLIMKVIWSIELYII